jgi:hypothetical protein
LNCQGSIALTTIVDEDLALSIFFHRFLDQLYSVSPHIGEFFHNLRDGSARFFAAS